MATPKPRSGKPSAERRDHYQEVTDRIIAALEAGTKPWRRPWDENLAGGPTMPINAVTGRFSRIVFSGRFPEQGAAACGWIAAYRHTIHGRRWRQQFRIGQHLIQYPLEVLRASGEPRDDGPYLADLIRCQVGPIGGKRVPGIARRLQLVLRTGAEVCQQRLV